MGKVININGKSYKECEVIGLPAEKARIVTPACFEKNSPHILMSDIYLKYHKKIKLSFYDKNSNWYYGIDNDYTPQHLYILSSEKIKENDWYMYCHFGEWIISNSKETLKNKTNTLENLNKDNYFKKVIATTDSEVKIHVGTCFGMEELFKPLPRPSDDFIKSYIKAQGKIDKVLVEFEYEGSAKCLQNNKTCNCDGNNDKCEKIDTYKLKVAQDNTITIKRNKEEIVCQHCGKPL